MSFSNVWNVTRPEKAAINTAFLAAAARAVGIGIKSFLAFPQLLGDARNRHDLK
jgi:hypothetical protein